MPEYSRPKRDSRKNLASKYLSAIGSPEILYSTPLKPINNSNINNGAVSPKSSQDIDKNDPSTIEEKFSNVNARNRCVPAVKRLILQKEQDTITNNAENFYPLPDNKLSKAKFAGFQKSTIHVEKRRGSNPSKSERGRMNKITHGISGSPSLKNLNKLKIIESQLNTRKVSNNNQRSVSGLQHKLKMTRDKSHHGFRPVFEEATVSSIKKQSKLDFICRLLEVKNWIEEVLSEHLGFDEGHISEFQDYFRNGVLLAEIVKTLDSSAISHIYYGQGNVQGKYTTKKGLYFKFTENIVQFLDYLKKVHMPEMFIFETRDLFEMKNFPKVIFCVQALSYMMAMRGKGPQLHHISTDEIKIDASEIKKVEGQTRGLKMPNFSNIYDGIRVNVGKDIEPLALVKEGKPEIINNDLSASENASDVDNTSALGTSSLEKNVSEEAPELSKDISFMQSSLNDSFSEPQKIINNDAEDNDSNENSNADDGNGFDDYSLVLEDPELKAADTTRARILFRDYNPTVNIDMDEIEKKYNALIEQDDDFDVTGNVNVTIQSFVDSDSPDISRVDGSFPVENLVTFQSLARGALVRYALFVDKFMLKVFTPDLISFQSLVRGMLLRKRLNCDGKQVLYPHHSRDLRAESLIDDDTIKAKIQLASASPEIILLQSFVRGLVLRSQLHELKRKLLAQNKQLTLLQGIIRGNQLRKRFAGKLGLSKNMKVIIRKGHEIPKSGSHLSGRKRRPVSQHGHQSRNGEFRAKLGQSSVLLYGFSAIARGCLTRRKISIIRYWLHRNMRDVLTIQSVFRGVLTRFYIEMDLEMLEQYSSQITELQACIKGATVRTHIKARATWFSSPVNIKKIVFLQNFVRNCIAAHDYKSLINERNPPLKAVKNYVGLLNGSDVELEDEISIERYKKRIATESQRIGKWEHDLKQLGLKLQLLKRNKISLEEVVKFKNDNLNLTEYSENLTDIMKSSLSSDPNKLLGKACKSLQEVYGKIFYLLQTQPKYFSELLTNMEFRGLRNEEKTLEGHIENWLLKVFNFGIVTVSTPTAPNREEFLLMKLILYTATDYFDELDTDTAFHNFLKQRNALTYDKMGHWEMLLIAYINLPQQRLFAKNLFSNLILRITSDSDAWYESDPSKIYKALLVKDEENGKITLRNLNMEDPIDDPDTRQQFVKNLSGLREASYDTMKIIGDSVNKLPLYLRSICREIYLQLRDQFPGESEKYYLSAVGSIFLKCYVLPLFINPSNYSINIAGISDEFETVEKVMGNLGQVACVLNQLVSMRPFSSTNMYLQPLNPFIAEFSEGVRLIIKEIINVESIDECYQMNSVYDDVVSHEKPTLRMDSDDVLLILRYIRSNIEQIAPERNDYLRYLLIGARELSPNHSKLDIKNGLLDIVLEPVTENTDSKDLETKALIMEAKRYVIYILQVQDGENLLDLLLSEISPQNELKFKEIVKREKKSIKNVNGLDAVLEKQALDDIYNSTYPQVKKHAIELILELEGKGVVTRSNCYQELLNDIAKDIKHKRLQKDDRERRLKVVVDTLTKLTQKEKTCSKLYSEYIKDIDRAMLKLQDESANRKKSFISRLFSRQYYYQLSVKRKKGYIPRFGSFKYNGKYLEEKRILDSITSTLHAHIRVNRVDFMFSSEKQGEFIVDVSNNSVGIFGQETVTLDDLLNLQYENKKQFKLFSQCVTFNTDEFATFIFHKFYRVK